MEELTIEQKAQRYDEAIKKLRDFYRDYDTVSRLIDVKEELANLFPELKESEDERIRKELIEQVIYIVPDKNEVDDNGNTLPCYTTRIDKYIAWLEKQNSNVDNANKEYWRGYREGKQEILDKYAELEKQGEQKPADKIQLGKKYKCIASPRYSAFVKGEIYKPEDKFLCSLMNFCSDCFEPIEDGEQKPADKVEPKFKVGDWVVSDDKDVHDDYRVCKITKIDDGRYYIEGGDFLSESSLALYEYRLWTIQDAKDGDVLFTSSTASHETFIFKSIDEKGNAKCYFAYDSEDGFREGKYHFIGRATNCKPATKEQRDTLMKAMADAGYIFDFDKKELRKLKFRVGDIVKSKSQPMLDARKIISIGKDCYWCEDRGCIGFAWEDDCELVEQNPTWSEEDEKTLNEIFSVAARASLRKSTLFGKSYDYIKWQNWLKSLRDRVQPQPKQEWSEEDRKIIIELIGIFESAVDGGHVTFPYRLLKDYIRILKSCIPQRRWKPTEKQMYNLSEAAHYNCAFFDMEILKGLYDDLKQL